MQRIKLMSDQEIQAIILGDEESNNTEAIEQTKATSDENILDHLSGKTFILFSYIR